jgi:hypothetical protein
MTEATILIPDNLNIKKVSDEIVYKAFNIAIEKKKEEIERELKRTDTKIKKFENKYKMSLEKFEKKMSDSLKAHDDWMDWSFLVENRQQLIEEMKNFKPS